MPTTITGLQLIGALNDALARVHEYDGSEVEDKLAVFGLQAEGVRLLLEERWTVYAAERHGDNPELHELFVRGFAEGLLTGLQLGRYV